jgi:hypothetical protein
MVWFPCAWIDFFGIINAQPRPDMPVQRFPGAVSFEERGFDAKGSSDFPGRPAICPPRRPVGDRLAKFESSSKGTSVP